MEKFHYNPISLTEQTLPWFPNVETLHSYKQDDDYLTGGRIARYCEWCSVSYKYYNQYKEMV